MSINAAFEWKCQPEAEQLLLRILDRAVQNNDIIAHLQIDLLKRTSTRLFDWMDHVVVGYSPELEKDLESSGFVSDQAAPTYRVFHHPRAQLPRLVMRDQEEPEVVGIAVVVESIGDFLMVRGKAGWIEGSPLSGYRRCNISTDNDVSLWVVERRGIHTMEPVYTDEGYGDRYLEALEKWQSNPREMEDDDEAMKHTIALAEELVDLLGVDLAAWVILEVERKYWTSRNTAGQIQKNRQDRLGMGWANHDHHTFRSSRKHFVHLVRLFEILGFHCRERFYAGAEAGWGAQVMENPNARLVLFLDVDLGPHEIEIDFAHHPLPETDQMGTIGLWCALHGDSILKSGMHHLEAQFMFEDLTSDLGAHGVGMMKPFSSYPYLMQAFTHGEVWHVDPARIERVLKEGKITSEQAEKFKSYGAVGSHMENLQRREGYKGFNQKNVSFIIRETDPRTIHATGA